MGPSCKFALLYTLWSFFLTVTYGLRPSLLVPLPGPSWVNHNQPRKLYPPISLLSPNWDDRTYVLKSFVIILRSSAPPSLRLDTRVGSNWVLKQTIYFKTYNIFVILFTTALFSAQKFCTHKKKHIDLGFVTRLWHQNIQIFKFKRTKTKKCKVLGLNWFCYACTASCACDE